MRGYGNFEGLSKDTMKRYPPRLLLLATVSQRHPVSIKAIARVIIQNYMTKEQLDKEIKQIETDMDKLAELRKVLLHARNKK